MCTLLPLPKQTRKQDKNFCEVEDVALVKACLDTSIDAIPGINKKRGVFWTRIHYFYHYEKEITVHRSPNSLSHRWTTIQECVNKFYGCFTAIDGRNQSGKTFENKVFGRGLLYFSLFTMQLQGLTMA
jgi:hypothetical protein